MWTRALTGYTITLHEELSDYFLLLGHTGSLELVDILAFILLHDNDVPLASATLNFSHLISLLLSWTNYREVQVTGYLVL